MSLLEVKNLVVEFPGRRGSLRALDDISFSIAPGEILGGVGGRKGGKFRGRRCGAIFQDPLTSLTPLYTVGRQLSETILAHLPVTPAEARQRAIGLLQDTGIPAAAQRI